MTPRCNEVTKFKTRPYRRPVLTWEALPLLPQAFQHGADYIKAIRQLVALRGRQIAFVPAHLQPQLAFIARTNGEVL
jgi:hypothetical protein